MHENSCFSQPTPPLPHGAFQLQARPDVLAMSRRPARQNLLPARACPAAGLPVSGHAPHPCRPSLASPLRSSTMGCRASKASVLPSHRNLDPAPPTPNPGRASFTQRRRPAEPAPTPNPSVKAKELPAAQSGGSWENDGDRRPSPDFESPTPAGRPAWMIVDNTSDAEYLGGGAAQRPRGHARRNNSQMSSAADMEVLEPMGGTRLQLSRESQSDAGRDDQSCQSAPAD